MQEIVKQYILFAESTLDTAGQQDKNKKMLRKVVYVSWSVRADFPEFVKWW
jgi:hypothetical protein